MATRDWRGGQGGFVSGGGGYVGSGIDGGGQRRMHLQCCLRQRWEILSVADAASRLVVVDNSWVLARGSRGTGGQGGRAGRKLISIGESAHT